MSQTVFPYVQFLHFFLISASIVISLVLATLFHKRQEHPQIPWLIGISLVMAIAAWFGALSLHITDLEQMTGNLRSRQLLTLLVLLLIARLVRTYFKGWRARVFDVLPLLLVYPFLLLLKGVLGSNLSVKLMMTPWGEQVYFMQAQTSVAQYFQGLSGMLICILGLFFSLHTDIRTKQSRYIWLAVCLFWPCVVGGLTIFSFMKSLLPVLPFSGVGFLILMMVPIFQEIAKSDQLAKDVQMRESQLRGMAMHNPGVLYSLLVRPDGSRKFLFLSERIFDVFGFPAHHPDPMEAFATGLSAEDLKRYVESERIALESRNPWNFTAKFSRPDGVSIWFQGLSQGYPHPEGIIFHGVLLDISARIVQEHEKESLLSEVSLRKDEMEAMLYTMSHDLRSPLVNIQGFATEAKALIEEYLENSTPEILKEATGRLQTVLQNTDRISKLISLLLEAGRHSRDSLNISVVDANAIMHEVLSSYSWRDLQMRVVVHQEHLSCQADAQRLKQVFKKVIENCVAYRKPEQPGEIQIHFSAVNAHLEIVIKDNGIGIEAKQAEMIFDAFTQVNPNKGRHGMGLTLARLLLRRMGGSIYAAGIPGVGMTVTLKLPISHGLV